MKQILISFITAIIIAIALNIYTSLSYFWLGVVIVVPVFICFIFQNDRNRKAHALNIDEKTKVLFDSLVSLNDKMTHIISEMNTRLNFERQTNETIEILKQLHDTISCMHSEIISIKNRQLISDDLKASTMTIKNILDDSNVTIKSIKSNIEDSTLDILNTLNECIKQIQKVNSTNHDNNIKTESFNNEISRNIINLLHIIEPFSQNSLNAIKLINTDISDLKLGVHKESEIYEQYVRNISEIIQSQSLEIRKQFKNMTDDISSKLGSMLREFKTSIEEFSDGTYNVSNAVKDAVKDIENSLFSFGSNVEDLNTSIDRFTNSFNDLKIEERKLTEEEKKLISEIKLLDRK